MTGLVARAVTPVGYDSLCRRSELVKLQADDVSQLSDGAASILVRRSKTDQAGEGRLAYLSETSMEMVRHWRTASGIDQGPLFPAIQGSRMGKGALHPCAINRILKQLAKRAGVNVLVCDRLSGHSMRVGAALDMAENGIDLVPIMHAGGWKSPAMVLRYTHQIDLLKSGMARLYALPQSKTQSGKR